MLYIVATPLGNLEDLSPRALKALQEADAVAAEDTRNTIRLLTHFGLQKPLFAFHQHNEREAIPKLCQRLEQGETIALVSDAGYPCISDAGDQLTQALRDRDIPYTCIPGPCAVDLALVLSGLPTRRFRFLGFLAREGQQRQQDLLAVAQATDTAIIYESPNRVAELLTDLKPLLGTRRVALLREMTKIHEECLRGQAAEVLQTIRERGEVKGECVLAVEGRPEETESASQGPISREEAVQKVLLLKRKADLPLSQAAQAVALVTGLNRKELYSLALDQEQS